MKKLLMLCLFLTACAAQSTPTPSLPHEPIPMCNYLFNSWEIAKAQGSKGIYFLISEKEALIFVMDSEVGLHELGHFVDEERDRPSQTQEFKDAVTEYLANPDPKDPELQRRFAFWLEIELDTNNIYAELWKLSLTGEIPTIFRQFFD